LPLYTGKIDPNNISMKKINEAIDELMKKYKKKGYTCVKKGVTDFKFVKGPNTHHVEIMRLGDGSFYFFISK
jgi:hypothetical protein